MNAEAFMKLVDDNDGFEFVIGYKDFVDHSIGGKGNKYWYYVDYNGKKAEYYVGTYENGFWSDVFYSKKGSSLTSKTATSGTAIKKIVEKAYLCQEKIGTKSRVKWRNTDIPATITCLVSDKVHVQFRKTMESPWTITISMTMTPLTT